MSTIRQELIKYGVKIAQAGLVAGAGGNISARDGDLIWMKPSGFAMDDIAPEDWCGMDLATGKQVRGAHKPTSEVNMHLGIYRVRPETQVLFTSLPSSSSTWIWPAFILTPLIWQRSSQSYQLPGVNGHMSSGISLASA